MLKQFDKMRNKAVQVMWEPCRGQQYAVLFSRVLEVYSVSEDEPIHSVAFDTNQTSFTYLSFSQLIVSDDKGRLTIFNGVHKADGVEMRLVKTDYTRLKSLNASPDYSFISAVSNSSIVFWSAAELKAAFADEDENA